MWHHIVELCQSYPQLVIFLVIAIGYFIGQIKLGNFSLGATASILIVALFFGQLNIAVSPLVETLSFAIFIFCIGYKVGPEFFSSLGRSPLVAERNILFFTKSLSGYLKNEYPERQFQEDQKGGLLAPFLLRRT